MEFWQKYKTAIILIVITLGIIAIIYFWGKGEGKKYVPEDIVIPTDTQPTGTGPQFNPGVYTDAIYEDLSCNFCLHSTVPYNAVMKLSNSQLAILYNDWNKRYAKDFDNKTIIQAIKGEYTLWNTAWVQATYNLVLRLESLPGTQGRIKN